jgi:tetratricopeptide (TPR) repeat protein
MRRIAILATSLVAVLPAFAQTAPKAPAPAAPAAPAVPAAPAPPTTPGPHPKSAAENDAVVAMSKAADPDARIKAVDALMSGFPDTDYKSIALLMGAESYHQKKDEAKAILYGEQALEADGKSFEAMLLLADIYSQTTRSTDLDFDDRVAKADKYAKSALAELATAEKPNPQLSDADWANAKKGEESRAWEAMGLTAILRGKYDDAKTNIQKGMDLYPDPVDMLRVGRAYIDAKRYDDAITWADKAGASPAADDNIKRIAAADKARAQALKKK